MHNVHILLCRYFVRIYLLRKYLLHRYLLPSYLLHRYLLRRYLFRKYLLRKYLLIYIVTMTLRKSDWVKYKFMYNCYTGVTVHKETIDVTLIDTPCQCKLLSFPALLFNVCLRINDLSTVRYSPFKKIDPA